MRILREGAVLFPRILTELLGSFYSEAERFLLDADAIVLLTVKIIRTFTKIFKKGREIVEEMKQLGYYSVPLVLISMVFVAVIAVLEASYHVTLVINDVSILPGVVSRLIIQEGGTTITALIVICRVSPGITSELALKKETEQLDALRMMGVDVIEFLVLPRVIAGFLTLVALSIISTFVALMAAVMTCYTHLGMSFQVFWHSFDLFVSAKDFVLPFVKVMVYGFVIPVIASYSGLSSGSGATEIGRATTRSIVISGVTVITLDLVLTLVFRFLFWQ